MKTLKSLKDQYASCNAMGEALGVHPHQLARLVSKGYSAYTMEQQQ